MWPADEDALVDWLKERTGGEGSSSIGDDCALLELRGGYAVTVDTQIEGVHFVPGSDPARVARRLLAVNLSDLAAVGAEPVHAFLALSAPRTFDHQRFFEALLASCRQFGVELSGGDLSTQDRISAVLTLIGRRAGRRFVERTAARPGHGLWLGGPVGLSALGLRALLAGVELRGSGPSLPAELEAPRISKRALRTALRHHLAPEPQLGLGTWLAGRSEGAAIDISDGLAKDLHRLCRASGVGAEIDARLLPPFPAALARLSEKLGKEPLELMLSGGEDYVLLFTLPPSEQPPPPAVGRFRARRIGRIVDAPAPGVERVHLVTPEETLAIPAGGFDHFGR